MLGALAAVAFGVATVGALRPRAPVAPPCSGAEARFAGAWGEASERSLRERFLAAKLPYAQASFESVKQALDSYGEGWSRMHTEACEANARARRAVRRGALAADALPRSPARRGARW